MATTSSTAAGATIRSLATPATITSPAALAFGRVKGGTGRTSLWVTAATTPPSRRATFNWTTTGTADTGAAQSLVPIHSRDARDTFRGCANPMTHGHH